MDTGITPQQNSMSTRKGEAKFLLFDDLINPMSLDEFRDRYWEQDYLHISRGAPRFFEDLFSFADVDRCIFTRRTDPKPAITLVPPLGSGPASHHRVAEIATEKLYSAYHSGSTIRLERVQESWAPVAALTCSIEETLCIEAGVNMYMTPPNSQGFLLHYDPHDVLILQVDGSKEWYLYAPPLDLPVDTEAFHAAKNALDVRINEVDCRFLGKVRLEKGDVLYLPRGFPHKAVAESQASLHLTVALHPVYWFEFLRRSIEVAAARDPHLRASLVPGFLWDPKAKQRCHSRLPEILEIATREIDFADTLRAFTADASKKQIVLPDGHFEELIGCGALTLDDRVRRRTGLRLRFEVFEGQVCLYSGEMSLKGPAALAPAFSFVHRHRWFRVSDLPGLTDSARVTLVRRLIREGIVTREAHRRECPAVKLAPSAEAAKTAPGKRRKKTLPVSRKPQA